MSDDVAILNTHQDWDPLPSASSSSSSTSHTSAAVATLTSRRRPIPRKGHTKSRRGCLCCKRRRVKCPETRPECDNCLRLGLRCEYPEPRPTKISAVAVAAAVAMGNPPCQTVLSSSNPHQFSMDDLRFFQHFIFTAYPPLPIGGGEIWMGVARLSHEYDYLVHAILGLAASHLHLLTPSTASFSSQALTHRVRAIRALNAALSTPCTSRPEADARFASLMALTFQSSYMHDGMLDFLSTVRGCVVLGPAAMSGLEGSVFSSFTTQRHLQHVREMSPDLGEGGVQWYRDVAWYRAFAEKGLASVKALEPLCRNGCERTYYCVLRSTVEKAKESPLQGFAEICHGYSILEDITHDAFTRFVDPANPTAQILLAHFFLLEHELGMLAMQPVAPAFRFRGSITTTWVHEAAERVGPEYARFMAWPVAYTLSGNMREDVEQRIPLGGGVT